MFAQYLNFASDTCVFEPRISGFPRFHSIRSDNAAHHNNP